MPVCICEQNAGFPIAPCRNSSLRRINRSNTLSGVAGLGIQRHLALDFLSQQTVLRENRNAIDELLKLGLRIMTSC